MNEYERGSGLVLCLLLTTNGTFLRNIGRERNHRRQVAEIGRHYQGIALFRQLPKLLNVRFGNAQLHQAGLAGAEDLSRSA